MTPKKMWCTVAAAGRKQHRYSKKQLPENLATTIQFEPYYLSQPIWRRKPRCGAILAVKLLFRIIRIRERVKSGIKSG
jgi:hypothetical protein